MTNFDRVNKELKVMAPNAAEPSMMLLKDRLNLLLKMLIKARLAAGLRQLDVAQALGRPQSYVAKIEGGERKIDFIEVVDFCKVLDLQPEQLLKKLK